MKSKMQEKRKIRKKNSWILLLTRITYCHIMLSLWISAASANNIAPNAGYEMDNNADKMPDGWYENVYGGYSSEINFIWSTDYKYSGTHSAKIISTDPNGKARWWTGNKDIVVSPGKSYTIKGYVKTSGVSNGVYMKTSFLDSSTKYISSLPTTKISGTRDWTLLQRNVKVPSNAAYVRIEIRMEGSGMAWYDDVSFLPISSNMVTSSVFDSSGESQNGNISTLEISGNTISFDLELDGYYTYPMWFYASFTPATEGTYNVTVNRISQNPSNMIYPVYSYDRINWYHVNWRHYGKSSDYNYWVKFPVYGKSGQKIYFATHIPYTLSDYEKFNKSINTNKYVSVNSIGKSVEGRKLLLFSVTNKSSHNTKKKLVFIGAQHAALESTGTVNIEGMIYWLINESNPNAKKVRDNVIVYFIPMVNPDGVFEGNSRVNANNVDLNRDWIKYTQPETKAVKKFLDANCCFQTLTDVHTWPQDNIWWVQYGNDIRYENILKNLQDYVLPQNIINYTSDASSVFGAEMTKQGYGLGLTIEHTVNYNIYKTGWQTLDSIRKEGEYNLRSQLEELGFKTS